MKSFSQFLIENINELENFVNSTENEKIIHVNDNGEVVVEDTETGIADSDFMNPDDYDTFYSDEEDGDKLDESKKDKSSGATWGGEYIINLNFSKDKENLNEWEFNDKGVSNDEEDEEKAQRRDLLNKLHSKNKDKLNTDTLKYLFNLGSRSLEDVKNDGQQFVIQNKEGGGYELMRKKYNEKERHPLSD